MSFLMIHSLWDAASDGYVYDLYAFKEDVNPVQADCKIQIPL